MESRRTTAVKTILRAVGTRPDLGDAHIVDVRLYADGSGVGLCFTLTPSAMAAIDTADVLDAINTLEGGVAPPMAPA